MKPQQNAGKGPTDQQYRYLLGALFTTGASTLVLEIVGTRVISPYYGSSLYCWSALITVTLVSLAAGYNWGGRLADRNPSLTLFARLIGAASVVVAFVPVLRDPVLKLTSPLGVQLGALASATLLIAPALIVLSALGPLAIRLTTQAVTGVGRSAGDAYAISTLGSVLGAVLAGFVLVPRFGITKIFIGVAVLLLLLSALGHWLAKLEAPVKELAAAAAVALVGFWPRAVPTTNMRVNRESSYGQIKVLDFNKHRYLLVNGTTQSLAVLDTLESESQYAKSFEWALSQRPETRRALLVGIGAGLFPKALERYHPLVVDSVDIDPEIVQTARDWFDFAPKGQVFVEDGRTLLERGGPAYGAIFLDAFGSETPPYHLFTTEAFRAMKARLEPGGILAVNIVSIVRQNPGNEPWLSVYKTVSSVFGHVRAFQGSDTYQDLGNVVVFCSDAPIPGKGKPGRVGVRENSELMLSRELTPDPGELDAAPLLTDDFAPMEFLMAQTSERWRRQLQDKIPEILLY